MKKLLKSSRKTTKGQFARDDPAFLVLLAATFTVTTVSFGVMVHLPVLDMLYLCLWFVGVDCIFLGMVAATVFWFLTNRLLLSQGRNGYDFFSF